MIRVVAKKHKGGKIQIKIQNDNPNTHINTNTDTNTPQILIQIQNTNDDECCRGSPAQIAGIKAKDASKRWQRLPEASIKDRQSHKHI